MTWRTHVMGGIVSLYGLPLALPFDSMSLAILFAVIGSLLPDLDARESKLSNMAIGGVAPLKLIARLLSRSLGHRGPMHSLLAVLIIAVAFGLPLALLLDPFAGFGLTPGSSLARVDFLHRAQTLDAGRSDTVRVKTMTPSTRWCAIIARCDRGHRGGIGNLNSVRISASAWCFARSTTLTSAPC